MYTMEDEYTAVKYEDEPNYENDSEDEQKLTDYIMYKICPKNKSLNLCYVGHTINFIDRKRQHIKNTINQNDKHYHLKHYEAIRNNGGWEQWEMVEIEKYNCKTKLEARMREQELIEEHNANLNTLKAFISEQERKTNKQLITEKYRLENKELLKEQTKNYKEEHKDIIAEQMKKYRQENKEKINAKTREYRENNKEKHKEWHMVWREKNKEVLKEKRKIYDAKKKEEKLLPTEEITEEEKEQIKKEKARISNQKYKDKKKQERLALLESQKATTIEEK